LTDVVRLPCPAVGSPAQHSLRHLLPDGPKRLGAWRRPTFGVLLHNLFQRAIPTLLLPTHTQRRRRYQEERRHRHDLRCLGSRQRHRAAGPSFPSAVRFGLTLTPSSYFPSQVFQATDAPRYRNAFIGQLVCYVFSISLFFLLRAYYKRQNVLKRRQLRAVQRAESVQTLTGANPDDGDDDDSPVEQTHKNAFKDMTDRANPELVYSY
jgi:hypothetical protein